MRSGVPRGLGPGEDRPHGVAARGGGVGVSWVRDPGQAAITTQGLKLPFSGFQERPQKENGRRAVRPWRRPPPPPPAPPPPPPPAGAPGRGSGGGGGGGGRTGAVAAEGAGARGEGGAAAQGAQAPPEGAAAGHAGGLQGDARGGGRAGRPQQPREGPQGHWPSFP